MSFLLSGKAWKRGRDVADAMEEKKPKQVRDASTGREERSGTKWWEPTKKVAMEQKTHISKKSSKESGHSVIYERLEEKKAKESKQTSQEEFKEVKAAAERLSASQKKKRKKRKKKVFHVLSVMGLLIC